MISLVECCKTVPRDILGAGDSWLKGLGNISISDIFIEFNHRYNKMIQFWCVDGSDVEEDEEDFIGVEAISIEVSDISGNGYVARVDFVHTKGKYKI